MNSNARGLAALMSVVGLAATGIFAGCGGGDSISIGTTGSGGKGDVGGAGGEAGAGGGGMGGTGATGSCNNNGKVENFEACDDGNMVSGDGCETDCSFTCNNSTPATGDAKCNDKDPCNGDEKCQDDHTCAKGNQAIDGTACSNGQICLAGICSPDQCGDLFVSGKEECDDGNVTNGDGCDSCQFSCLSIDPSRDCTNLDPCVATVCDDNTHTCGKPLPDGVTCIPGSVCKSGICTATVCGDGNLEAGEICDDGNLTDGDGCDADCTRSCVNPATDCPAAPVCQTNVCNAAFVCAKNNANSDPACMAPNTCQNGACQAPAAVCGNGILETGEDCDFGGGNGANAGCETNCKFSCLVNTDCVDTNTCNGTESCTNVNVGGKAGKKCSAGMNQMDCTACMGGLCKAGACTPSTCGDACVDATTGEQCEPPNTMACDSMCKTIVMAICGNGTRESGEQCDDGNIVNMDGCSAACKFEQIQRVNWLAMQFGTDAYCPDNRLGSAIASQGQNTISTALTDGVNTGSISIMFQALNLDDLSGTTAPMFQMGALNAVPVPAPMGVTYNGASDLEWWYTVDALSLDPARLPTDKLNGTIVAKLLNAGPGPITIKLILGGSPASLRMSETRLTATIGNVSTPLASMSDTPGHLATENLNPALQSFATMAQPNTNAGGKICGNVTASSLAQVPVPMALLSGTGACIEGYTAANSFLDVLIGGCKVLGGFITVINIRQPDQQDPAALDAGAGYPYTLSRNGTTKAVNGCKDKNMNTVNLAQCLDDASYSAFFKFATDRVIGK